jgi:hypothetical protein
MLSFLMMSVVYHVEREPIDLHVLDRNTGIGSVICADHLGAPLILQFQ